MLRDIQAPARDGVVFAGGTIVDGTGAPALDNAWVHVRDDRVVAMGQGDPPTGGSATRVDARGRTILPGLSDMHVHVAHGSLAQSKWVLKLLLAHGVTAAKDAGGPMGRLAAVRRWLTENPVNPRLRISGVTLNGNEPELRFLREGKETQALLDNNLAFGVDFLKIHNWISSAALRQIAAFARRHDLYLTGHVPLSMTSVAAIEQGMTILEHVRLHPAEVHDDPALVARFPMDLRVMLRTAHWAHFDPRSKAIARTLDAWEAHRDRIFLDPTIVVQDAVAFVGLPTRADGPRMDHLAAPLRTRILAARTGYIDELPPDQLAEVRGSVAGMTAFAGLAFKRGIRLLTGSDVVGPFGAPGASLIRELEFLVEAGLTPVQAIHASTGQAGLAFRSADHGVLKPGALADLVIVTGDASRDIRALRDIEQVMLNGRLHRRADLLADAAVLAEADEPADRPEEAG